MLLLITINLAKTSGEQKGLAYVVEVLVLVFAPFKVQRFNTTWVQTILWGHTS
jgi:hypothetical protein